MENLRKRLEKRGWHKQEIEKAIRIIKNAKKNKTKENIFLEKRMFWILLAVLMAANFAVPVALIPLLIALNGFLLYFTIRIPLFINGTLCSTNKSDHRGLFCDAITIGSDSYLVRDILSKKKK